MKCKYLIRTLMPFSRVHKRLWSWSTVTVLFQMDFSSEILCLIVMSYFSLFVKSSVFCFYDFSTFSSVVDREEEESEEEGEDPALDSLSQAIAFQVSAQMYFKLGEVSRLLYYLKPSIYLVFVLIWPLFYNHTWDHVFYSKHDLRRSSIGDSRRPSWLRRPVRLLHQTTPRNPGSKRVSTSVTRKNWATEGISQI